MAAVAIYVFLIALTSCNKAWTQEVITLELSGVVNAGRGFVSLVCTASSESVVENITLTINGNSDVRIFGTDSGRIRNNQVEFTSTSFTPSNNSRVALCHYGRVTSNPYNFSITSEDLVPITFNAQLILVLPEELIITCNSNTNEINPDTIILRLNGFVSDAASNTTDVGKIFYMNSTLFLNDVVAQCTSGPMLGSLPGIIYVRERVCEDCMDQYFCDGASPCYPSTTLCDSSIVSACGEPCEMLNKNTCERCLSLCGPSEYFCVSSSSCVPYTTLCDGTDRCSEGCQTQFTTDEDDDFCASCMREEECDSTEYFCRSTQTCLSYSTLCNGMVECQLTCFDTADLRTDQGAICGANGCNPNEINCVLDDGSSQCVAPSTTAICTGNFQCTNVCRDMGLSQAAVYGLAIGVPVGSAVIVLIVIVFLLLCCCCPCCPLYSLCHSKGSKQDFKGEMEEK